MQNVLCVMSCVFFVSKNVVESEKKKRIITKTNKKDQKKAPILEAIKKYHQKGIIPFTTPAHKRGEGVLEEDKIALGPDIYYNDITMQNGADDRKESKAIQETAEALMADAIGA